MPQPKRLTLRLPPELHQLLLKRAEADHRSLNREIEFLLWQVFQLDVDAFARTRFTAHSVPVPAKPGTGESASGRK